MPAAVEPGAAELAAGDQHGGDADARGGRQVATAPGGCRRGRAGQPEPGRGDQPRETEHRLQLGRPPQALECHEGQAAQLQEPGEEQVGQRHAEDQAEGDRFRQEQRGREEDRRDQRRGRDRGDHQPSAPVGPEEPRVAGGVLDQEVAAAEVGEGPDDPHQRHHPDKRSQALRSEQAQQEDEIKHWIITLNPWPPSIHKVFRTSILSPIIQL